MINIEIKAGRGLIEEKADWDTTVLEIKQRINNKKRISIDQQRLEIANLQEKRVVLENSKTLSNYKEYIEDGKLSLVFKDLGMQVKYANFFYLEYSFPIFSFLLFLLCNLKNSTPFHFLMMLLVIVHFGKRLLETKYVHIFSIASVPVSVAIRNCIYYWIVFGILVPIEVFYVRKQPQLWSSGITFLLTTLFFLFEFLNFYCHYQLRQLRVVEVQGVKSINSDKKIPTGLFFDSIISPNYTFEILAWLTFSILFSTILGFLFASLGCAIMTSWALEKKKKLLKLKGITEQEKHLVQKRYLTIPFVI